MIFISYNAVFLGYDITSFTSIKCLNRSSAIADF